ncbi:MAG: hypothetical protein ABFS09_08210, partial [Thermodesulfobacteriota bacterium]
MNQDHNQHLANLDENIESDERIQELRAKMAFLLTPGVDYNTLTDLCADTPFMANENGSDAAMKSFKTA